MKTKGWKKRMAMLLILLVGWHITARPGVIITGILHGTLTGGSPKAIELFITGTENLNNYEVWRSLNGAPFGSGTGAISSMSGVFTNTFVYLVKPDHVNAFHDVFGNEGIFTNVVPMGIINGNGNDGFQVRLKVGSVVVDQVWQEDATDSYRDSYWYRKHGTGPDGGWLPSAWETPGNDALDGLDEAGLQAAVPFGTYAVMWQGLTDDWNNNGNWSTGIAPSFQTNVQIPETAANFPVIDNLPENPAVCMNLTVADTARLTVNTGKALTVHGNLILENQSPGESDQGLILKSVNSQVPAGSLVLTGNPSGTAILERYIAKDNGWHFLSSPMVEQTFQPEFVPDPMDQSFDLYYWEENGPPSVGWINIRDDNGQWNPQFGDAFIPGKGYLVAYSAANSGALTRIFSGLLNYGNQDILLGHSGNYWNLLGNPYSCALDWSSGGIDKAAVAASTMYIWDPGLNENLGGYRAHNGTTGVPAGTTSIIPAIQGFFVQSMEAGNLSIDILNDQPLVHAGQPFYKSKKEPSVEQIRLKISKNQWSDETLIYFDPAATNQFDAGFDAEKLFNGHADCPEIFSIADDHQLCINILADDPASVALGISYNQEDTLTLTAFDFEGIPQEIGIFLEDNLQSTWLDMREQPEYRFNHMLFQPETRFTLYFMNVARLTEPVFKDEPDFWCFENRIYVSNPRNITGHLLLYSLEGRCLESFRATGRNQVIQSSLPTGLYVLRFVSQQFNSGRKIFIY
ncbi:MAG: T9SS type A sorting domain-containing protein [Bacteroidales bacterium]|nr:T9SS type A sorting domain-containing protein [Bacteroidales bacterium]